MHALERGYGRCVRVVLDPSPRSSARLAALALGLCCLFACAPYGEDLRRAERAFVDARYEEVNVWLLDLRASIPDMSRLQRARYYYMAGVTAARLGDRDRARHYLLLCREEAAHSDGALSDERMRNLKLTLQELE